MNWTPISQAIAEHSTKLVNGLIIIEKEWSSATEVRTHVLS